MADKKNILLLTNYFGFMHIVPVGNKDFYQSHNEKNPDKQYKWKEMDEEKATAFIEKNGGFDPDFKSPKQMAAAVSNKDAEIQQLKDELAKNADKDNEIAKLRALLEQASTAATEPNAKGAAVKEPK